MGHRHWTTEWKRIYFSDEVHFGQGARRTRNVIRRPEEVNEEACIQYDREPETYSFRTRIVLRTTELRDHGISPQPRKLSRGPPRGSGLKGAYTVVMGPIESGVH